MQLNGVAPAICGEVMNWLWQEQGRGRRPRRNAAAGEAYSRANQSANSDLRRHSQRNCSVSAGSLQQLWQTTMDFPKEIHTASMVDAISHAKT
jgi:hypothetical protein